jgi:hypothetical protein
MLNTIDRTFLLGLLLALAVLVTGCESPVPQPGEESGSNYKSTWEFVYSARPQTVVFGGFRNLPQPRESNRHYRCAKQNETFLQTPSLVNGPEFNDTSIVFFGAVRRTCEATGLVGKCSFELFPFNPIERMNSISFDPDFCSFIIIEKSNFHVPLRDKAPHTRIFDRVKYEEISCSSFTFRLCYAEQYPERHVTIDARYPGFRNLRGQELFDFLADAISIEIDKGSQVSR